MENIEEQIKTVIHKLRPYLQRDGGDIEFVEFKDGIVYVKMLGDGLLSVDGIHEMQLHEGDKVTIKKAPFPTKMLRLTPRNPYSLVREKLL